MSALPDFTTTQAHGFCGVSAAERAALLHAIDPDDYHGADTSRNFSMQPLGDDGAEVPVHFDFHPSCDGIKRPGDQFFPADILLEWVGIKGHRVDAVEFSPARLAAWRAAIAAEETKRVRDARADAQLRRAGVL